MDTDHSKPTDRPAEPQQSNRYAKVLGGAALAVGLAVAGYFGWGAYQVHAAEVKANLMTSVAGSPVDNDPSNTVVTDVWVNDYYLFNAGAGGSSVCCVTVPKYWRPGLTAQVRWRRCPPRTGDCSMFEKTVEIKPYPTDLFKVYVHFIPGDEALVIPSDITPENPEYPGPPAQRSKVLK